eukprot:TRINITY_DN8241_c0_g1_i2.p1 TRINITY_DN8241_c0_g1~~TRINITY_DN8241_c0_g1_i2.p1  ORF type:complete len:269 (+),score=31.79 TRINITY_DN8241_c0_g1_i2:286-1092(+)
MAHEFWTVDDQNDPFPELISDEKKSEPNEIEIDFDQVSQSEPLTTSESTNITSLRHLSSHLFSVSPCSQDAHQVILHSFDLPYSLSIWKCLLPSSFSSSQLHFSSVLESFQSCSVLLCCGGYFAGAVFVDCTGQMLVHKATHRFVNSKKPPGSSSRNSKKSSHSAPKKYDERKQQNEVADILTQWSLYLQQSRRIFCFAPGPNQAYMFGSKNAKKQDNVVSCLLDKDDDRIVSIPFPVRDKPNFEEVKRVFRKLTSIGIVRDHMVRDS